MVVKLGFTTSKDLLRGFTPTFLAMDEVQAIDNGSQKFQAAASLGTVGKISTTSTPNSLDPLYYKTYDGAKKKKDNNFNIAETEVASRWHI